MVNAGGCGARGCIDVQDSVRVRKLKEWAESDALFLRKLRMTKEELGQLEKNEKLSASVSDAETSPQTLDERFACRQRYLRSYTFGNNTDQKEKDTSGEKITKKWLKLKKENNIAKGYCLSAVKRGVKFFSCMDLRKS